MYRRLALAGLLATASTQAYALGLGPIKLHSGLNQPLDADVELLSGSPQDLSQVQVSLAPSAAFQQAGVQRTMLLARLNFKVVKRPNGAAFIHISSPMPIREPFLDFVLEVDWSGGQLMREYTVLINPPTFMAHAAPPPASVPATSSAAQQPQTAASQPSSGTPTMAQAAAAAGDQAHAGQYGPTKRTDTLWKIAGDVRPDDRVSREQAMLALLRANPDAFYGGNINRLKAGYVLRVPDRSNMVSLSRTQARVQVAQQNTVWREARNNGKIERQASTKPAATSASGGRLKLLAPEPDQEASAAVGGTGSSAGASATAGTAAAGDDVAALRNQLNTALAAADAQRHQTEELEAQVAQLQKQVQSMHHLIEMRDGKMAQLQGQSAAAATGAAAATPSAAAATTAATGPDAGAPAAQSTKPTSGSPANPADATATDTTAKTEAAAKPDATAKPAAEAPAPAQTAAEQPKPAANPAPAAAPKPAPVHHAAPAAPAPQPSIWDELLENPMMVGLGGAGTLLVLLLGWVSMRRRRMTMTEFQESILAAEQANAAHGSETDTVPAVADSSTDSSDGAASESSLLSDFAVSDMDAIQSEGEADPLAEADVYLAYGRYQQAEELVTEALNNAPDRNDLHMKLLEIYHAAQNAPAFDGHAEAFLARLDNQDDPLWSRVVEMGREISPDNPLYGSGSAGDMSEATALNMDIDEGDESDTVEADSNELEAPELMAAVQDVDAAEPELAESQAAEAEEADNGLDFDLDFDLGDDVSAPAESSADADLEDLEFNLDNDEPKADADADLSQVLNFDLDAGTAGERHESAEPAESLAMADTLDMSSDASLAPAEESVDGGNAALDEVGLDLDLGSLPELGEGDADDQGEAEDSEGLLSDVDEVGTKLDLARAYMDMGDPDGARSILEEVRQEGNGDQQEEAKTLLGELA
jgi:pilus assembly protein FimV